MDAVAAARAASHPGPPGTTPRRSTLAISMAGRKLCSFTGSRAYVAWLVLDLVRVM
jgi:hypothetical protein